MSEKQQVFRVRNAPFSIESPWSVPAAAEEVELLRAIDGGLPRLTTRVAAFRDDYAITFIFTAADDAMRATHLGHDAPLYEEDVVEMFLAPGEATEYFEIEVNPLGTTFDARISSPDGVRATMRADLSWTCDGLLAAVQRTSASGAIEGYAVLARVPFAALGVASPRRGDVWSGNLFRIDRHAAGDEFSAWCPTMRTPADFHVVAAFGLIEFE